MNNKASLQLSMNFLITIIIALLVFGIGIAGLYKIINGLDIFVEKTWEETEKEIMQSLISTGTKVGFPFEVIEIKRNKHSFIGLGVNNFNTNNNEYFMIETECIQAINEKTREVYCDKTSSTPCEDIAIDYKPCGEWIVNDEDIFNVKSKRNSIVKISVSIPKKAKVAKYIYILKVYACDNELCDGAKEQYDVTRDFKIIVK